eukprot:1740460-Pyramimonas_sp.AAC.1
MMKTFLMYIELQMSYRAAWHIHRKNAIRISSLNYLDARTRATTRVGTNTLFMSYRAVWHSNQSFTIMSASLQYLSRYRNTTSRGAAMHAKSTGNAANHQSAQTRRLRALESRKGHRSRGNHQTVAYSIETSEIGLPPEQQLSTLQYL